MPPPPTINNDRSLIDVKQHQKGSELFHKSCATAVAMATITFQDGGNFGFNFKVINLENDICDPQTLFYEMISFSILNYFDNFKKILFSQKTFIKL